MIKFILLTFLLFSLALACHPSCNCDQGSNICTTCKVQGATTDQYGHFCPCPSGYYVSSLEPYSCARNINLDNNGQDISQSPTSCQIETSKKAKDLKINSQSSFSIEQGNSYVSTVVSLDTSGTSLLPECIQDFITTLQYNNTQTNTFQNVQPEYLIEGSNGEKTVKYPLIYLYDIAGKSEVNSDNQIQQTINFKYNVNNTSSLVREHYFDLVALTNKDQVETFTFDVSINSTAGCLNGQDCVIVADLDTKGIICETAACDVPRTNTTYFVGDNFIAKIQFVDPTYTKILEFSSLYLRNDQQKIYNFSGITTSNWSDNGLIIQLPLVEPTSQATIQVNLDIQSQSVLRRVLANDSKIAKSTFTASVLASETNNSASYSKIASISLFWISSMVVSFFLF